MININLLPSELQSAHTPSPWRYVTIAVPLVALCVLGAWTFLLNLEETRLKTEKNDRELTKRELQPFLREYNDLTSKKRDLLTLLAVRDEVKDGTISWSNELALMLETIPPSESGQPAISFDQLTMTALDSRETARYVNDLTYEGMRVVAEMNVNGQARDAAILSRYVRALQDSPLFGVSFKSASRDDATGSYDFNMYVGAAEEGRRKTAQGSR